MSAHLLSIFGKLACAHLSDDYIFFMRNGRSFSNRCAPKGLCVQTSPIHVVFLWNRHLYGISTQELPWLLWP